jgi:NADH:ubiquinone oxidoreductase subunit 4 (subunit M)
VILVIFFGFYPAPLLDVFGASVDNLVGQVTAGLDASATRTAAQLP